MKFPAFALTALLCSATHTAGAFGLEPYQTYDIGSSADAVAVGDVNGDRRDDVVVVTRFSDPENDKHIFLFLQQEDGTLAPPQKHTYPSWTHNTIGLAIGDMTGDGRKDIVVGHDDGITIFKNVTKGLKTTFNTANYDGGWPVGDLSLLDVDRDGFLDITGHKGWAGGAVVLYGNGTGGIRETRSLNSDASGYSDLDVGDLNADGYPDLALTTDSRGVVHVFYHDTLSGFRFDFLELDAGYLFLSGLAIADFDSDGLNDLAVSTSRSDSSTPISMFFQRSGQLSGPEFLSSNGHPGPILGADMNGDGLSDLVLLHDVEPALGVYLQEPEGFRPELVFEYPYATWNGSHTLATGDINDDGCADVVAANYNYGLVWFYGNGCQVPDLGVAVGLTPTIAAIRLEHVSGTAELQQPLVQIDLSVRSGALQTGTLPAGCVLESQSMRMSRVECLVDTMTPGTVTTLIVPFSVASSNFNLLTASARASTDTTEHSLSNNQTSKTIVLRSAKQQSALKRPVAKATQR